VHPQPGAHGPIGCSCDRDVERFLLRSCIREQRGLTRFAGPEAFAMALRLPTTTNEAKTVPRRGHTSFQWDRARLLLRQQTQAIDALRAHVAVSGASPTTRSG
jgi:hypothetical protein